jgi:class 3 adenylate cyclase
MRCSNCETDNVPGSRFCNGCGAALNRQCAKCGFENARESRYCAQCGTQLDATTPIHAETGRYDNLGGERRHLTVLFSDLVGSTEIASHLDPERWREIVADYHHAAARVIERYGGSVAQYLGDGVMAYFGWPEAHDNDAERGVHAGLAILSAISKFNVLPDRPKLSVRIGIDSGAVVVGSGTDKSADVFGDTPNIAARVQAAAEPSTVVVTDAVHRLVSGLFVVENCGTPVLKGIERQIQLYRVVQPSGVRGRLQAAAAVSGLTPFVGREDELRLLMNRWERALEGEGQMALIVGEAGIGKSRLVQHFREQIARTPHSWVEAAAGPFFQNTPFHPVTEMLRELLAWRGDEPPDEQLTQLESALALAGIKPAEALPLIAPLLNLPTPAKYPALALSPDQQRRRLLAMLVEWALGAARVQSTIVAIEDLHWADPSTLELLRLLVEQGATAPLLLLYTARPEFRVPWPMRSHHTQITLNRLNVRNVRTMVAQVAAQKALSEDTIAAVIERTGGVPLFVEELTRTVLESGDAKLSGRQIPVTLHDSLMARLDRLGAAKEVAQVGSVIGNEFSYELLHAVGQVPDGALQGSSA